MYRISWILLLLTAMINLSAIFEGISGATSFGKFMKFTELDDKSCLNGKILSRPASSPTQCAIMCNQNESCVDAAFSSGSKQCFLYDTFSAVNECTTQPGHVHYYKVKDCPDGYEKYENDRICYKLVENGTSWENARTQCQMDGTDLVVIKTEAFRDFLHTKITSGHFYFIGASYENGTGQWVDGTTSSIFLNDVISSSSKALHYGGHLELIGGRRMGPQTFGKNVNTGVKY